MMFALLVIALTARTLFIPMNGEAYLWVLVSWATVALFGSLNAFLTLEQRAQLERAERARHLFWMSMIESGHIQTAEMLRIFAESSRKMTEAATAFNDAMRSFRDVMNWRQRLRFRVMHASSRRIKYNHIQPESAQHER